MTKVLFTDKSTKKKKVLFFYFFFFTVHLNCICKYTTILLSHFKPVGWRVTVTCIKLLNSPNHPAYVLLSITQQLGY